MSKIPLALLAEEALKKAVGDVIREREKSGDPLAIWQDGKVIKVPADRIEVREAQTDYTTKEKSKIINP